MKKCPFCAEQIQDEAIVCKHCGRDFRQAPQPATPPPPQAVNVTIKPARKLGCGGAVVVLIALVWIANELRPKPSAAPPSTTTSTVPRTPSPWEAARRDIGIDVRCKAGGFGSVALLDITMKNKSKTATYRDIIYRTTYAAESGTELHVNRGTINVLLKPGQTRVLRDFNDGFIPKQVRSCSLVVIGATLQP